MLVKFINLTLAIALSSTVFLLLSTGCCSSELAGKSVAANRQLTIELHIPGKKHKPSSILDAEVVLRNIGKKALKVPMCSGEYKFLFFSFYLMTKYGYNYIVECPEAWFLQDEKPVRMVLLEPGKEHRVKLEKALDLGEFGSLRSWQHVTCYVAVTYSDYSQGHMPTYPEYGKNDPLVWKGAIISDFVRIEIENIE